MYNNFVVIWCNIKILCPKYRSELLGLEGIVKLKHLEDSNLNVSIIDDNSNDPLSSKLKTSMKNATLPLDVKLNGIDYELRR